jgi:cell wall-associated NlpC family hydrolase
MTRRSSFFTTVTVAAVLAAGVFVGPASPALAAPSYPSWDDVTAARANENQKKVEIDRLTGLLATLKSDADAKGVAALQAGEAYQVALVAEQAATKTSDDLKAKLATAKETADASAKKVGRIVAQLGRTGAGGDLGASLFTGGGTNASDLLSKLGTLNQVGAHSAELLEQAKKDANQVTSLSEQAEKAAQALTVAAEKSKSALAVANAAAQASEKALAEQQSHADELDAQLAYLKGQTENTEKEYQASVEARAEAARQAAAAAAAEQARQAAAAQAAAEAARARAAQNAQQNTNGSRPSGGGAAPAAPAPAVPAAPAPAPSGSGAPSSAAASAVAFAYAQLGDPYVFAAEGPNAWDCSGLTMIAYRQAGVYIGYHTVGAQYRELSKQGRLASASSLVPGDLLFYSPGKSTNSQGMYHITIYVGGGKMIEAPEPGKRVQLVPVRTHNLVPYVGRPAG